jgi:hypothetical protein
MQQYLMLGVGPFGAAVLDRVRALPLDKNIVFHRLDCPPDRRVVDHYLDYRKRLLDVLNREVFNFANTPLTVFLVGLLVEEHMAENLMHLGYLFKTLFRENIILSPRIKVLTALPTLLPEEAYAWLPATRRTLDEIDGYAGLKAQFQPSYAGVKRVLPSISGPPFEEVWFCYSESLDQEDVAVSAQAAATKVFFDLALFPPRLTSQPAVREFYRNAPLAHSFFPISGCAVAFLPSLAKLLQDEMEYVVMLRLCEGFLPGEPPPAAKLEPLLAELLKKVGAERLEDLVGEVVTHAFESERWFDPKALDPLAQYDVAMSPPPEVHLQRVLTTIDNDRQRFASRVRELAVKKLLELPARLLDRLREDYLRLNLAELEGLLTRAFFHVSRLLDGRKALVQKLKDEWSSGRGEVEARIQRLKTLMAGKGATLKRGGETEAKIREVFRTVAGRDVLAAGLAFAVAEGLAAEETLEARLREGYETVHRPLESFLGRRDELLTHLRSRRDAALKQRELYLYVFNQVFREKFLDAELQRKLRELEDSVGGETLATAVGSFFFKKWLRDPALPMGQVEAALNEAIRREAQGSIEAAAAGIRVDYADVVRILREVADAHVSSIFDSKYKEHPQAAYRQAMFLCHKDPSLPQVPGGVSGGYDLTDVACVPDLPFQVLQVTEIYNLPFRALRQYASLDRQA